MKYLALVRKSEFIDMFKYGSLYLNKSSVISIENEETEYLKQYSTLNRLFKYSNPFEYTFEYLIISFKSESFESNQGLVFLDEVVNIYPLDTEAYLEMKDTLDSRIHFSEPLCLDFVKEIQIDRMVNSQINGARNIWKIFQLDSPIDKYEAIINRDIIKNVIRGLFEDKRPVGDISIWEYLLRYERHSFYSERHKGFFEDAVHVALNCINKEEIMSIETTSIYQEIESAPKNNFSVIKNILETSNNCEKYRNTIQQIVTGINYTDTASIYFYLKHLCKEGLNYKGISDNLNKLILQGESFYMAMYLLGVFLGHDKTYDTLYEILPLKIFIKPAIENTIIEEPPIITGEGTKKTDNDIENLPLNGIQEKGVNTTDLIETTADTEIVDKVEEPAGDKEVIGENNHSEWPKYLYKPRGKTPKKVHNQKEYDKFYKKGYTSETPYIPKNEAKPISNDNEPNIFDNLTEQ